jgi:hypothetical protein
MRVGAVVRRYRAPVLEARRSRSGIRRCTVYIGGGVVALILIILLLILIF